MTGPQLVRDPPPGTTLAAVPWRCLAEAPGDAWRLSLPATGRPPRANATRHPAGALRDLALTVQMAAEPTRPRATRENPRPIGAPVVVALDLAGQWYADDRQLGRHLGLLFGPDYLPGLLATPSGRGHEVAVEVAVALGGRVEPGPAWEPPRIPRGAIP